MSDISITNHGNERREAHEHLAYLSGGDLVIYDRGYLSFSLIVDHVHRGVDAVFRVSQGPSFIPVERFWKSNKTEEIVTIDPGVHAYHKASMQFPEFEVGPVQMRLIKYFIEGKTYVIATTILDLKIPGEDFIELYAKRWISEELFKVFKQTLQLEEFHSKSEQGIKQELEAMTLLWNLSRMLGSMADPVIKKSARMPIFIALFRQFSTRRIEGRAES